MGEQARGGVVINRVTSFNVFYYKNLWAFSSPVEGIQTGVLEPHYQSGVATLNRRAREESVIVP